MSLVQLIVPTEVAHDTIAELGELGNVQFKDVSPLPPYDANILNYMNYPAEPRCQSFPTLLRGRNPPHRRDGAACAILRESD